MESNSNNKVIIPLVIAVFFAGGIFIGTMFTQNVNIQNPLEATNSKFETILQVIEDRYVDSVNHKLILEGSIDRMIKE